MADALQYSIQVKDNFTTSLNKLSNSLNKLNTEFTKVSSTLDRTTTRICSNLDRINRSMDKMGNNTTRSFQRVTNSLGSNFTNVERQQERSIANIERRYQQMTRNINNSLNGIHNPNPNVIGGGNTNGSNNGGGNSSNGNNGLGGFNYENMFRNLFAGNFTSIISKLGLIGVGITGVKSAIKLVDSTMNSGFDILNKVTGNLFSAEGIKDAISTSFGFETGRQSLDLFYGDKGAEQFKIATKIANETYASEKDTVSILSKLGMVGVTASEDQLMSLMDVSATRPTVSADHIGLAVQEAIDGRIAMLKLYGINNYKLQDYYKWLQKNDTTQAKQLKGALNKKGTAGDSQKYFNLVTSFIASPFSHMAGYADTYTQTLQGKLDRLSGLFDKAKAEIMGIDTDTGKAISGGLFSELGKAVDELKKKLENKETIEFMSKIGEAFGTVASGLSKSFMTLINGVDLNKVADSINKVANVVCDSLNKLIDSGVLNELIEKLPKIIEQLLGFKAIEAETSAKVSMDVAERNWGKAVKDYATGTSKKYYNYLNPDGDITNYDSTFGKYWDIGVSAVKGAINPAKYLWDTISSSDNSSGTTVTDAQISSMLNNNYSMSTEDKQQVRDYIKNDNAETYSINTVNVYANNPKQLLEELKASANNRK